MNLKVAKSYVSNDIYIAIKSSKAHLSWCGGGASVLKLVWGWDLARGVEWSDETTPALLLAKKKPKQDENEQNSPKTNGKRFRPRWALRPCRAAVRLVLLYSQGAYTFQLRYKPVILRPFAHPVAALGQVVFGRFAVCAFLIWLLVDSSISFCAGLAGFGVPSLGALTRSSFKGWLCEMTLARRLLRKLPCEHMCKIMYSSLFYSVII